MKRALLFSFAFTMTLLAAAQENPNLEKGLKRYGSYEGGNIDTAGLSNGNLMVHGPLWVSSQRGGKLTLDYWFGYNNKGYAVNEYCDSYTQICNLYWYTASNESSPTSVQVVQGRYMKMRTHWVNLLAGGDPDLAEWVEVDSVSTADGGNHQLAGMLNVPGLRTIDGSGIRWNSSVFYDRSGVKQYDGAFQNNTMHTYFDDPNGNQLSWQRVVHQPGTFTDTLGRALPGVLRIPGDETDFDYSDATPTTDFTHCTGPRTIVSAGLMSFPGPGGTVSQVKLCYAQVPILTHFNYADSGRGPANEFGNSEAVMLQSIVLPDNTAWTFEYDSRDPGDDASVNYGDLTKITFPTGGTLAYTWKNIHLCNQGTSLTKISRAVASRTLNANDGTGAHTWTYTYSGEQIPTSANSTTTVKDPLNNETVHSFTGLGGSCSLFETQTQYYQGLASTGTLLKTEQTDYSYNSPSPFDWLNDGAITAYNVYPTQSRTIWPNGLTSATSKSYDLAFTAVDPTGQQFSANYGSVTAQSDYDYGQGAVGPLLRQSFKTYKFQSDTNYRDSNLLDLPASTTLYDGNGYKCAGADFTYDDAGRLHGASISTGHLGTVSAVRGNPSSTASWLSQNPCTAGATGSSLTAYSDFFDTGTAYSTTDAGGHTTSFAYDTAYAGAYVTSTTNALSHVIHGAYDFNTGLLTSFTDANSQTSTYSYDNMLRFTSAVFPNTDGAGNHGQVNFTYPDIFTVHRSQRQSASVWKDDYVYFDGLGRLKQTKLVDPEGDVFAETAYDAMGRASSVTNPHRTAAGPTDGTTSTAYDALGRAISVTKQDGGQVVTQYAGNCVVVYDETGRPRRSCSDALGRLIAVGEPNPSTGSLGTGGYVTNYQYDALGNLLRVDQVGDQPTDSSKWRTRLFTYDSLSRLLTANNPETGTVSYAYDADGNLTSKVSPKQNQTAGATQEIDFTYDALHRLTFKCYAGTTTPCNEWDWDQSVVWGHTIPNPIGRLTFAGQQFVYGIIPDYDTMGRTTQEIRVYAAGAYYTTAAAYDLAGNMTSLTYPSGRKVSNSYSAAGRETAVNYDSFNGSPVNSPYWAAAVNTTSPSYFPSGALRQGVLGNGLSDTTTYNNRLQVSQVMTGNATTLFMNRGYSYSDPANGKNNGNVWLIGDQNSAHNQTFTYDQLNRITAAAQADNAFSQTFQIDPWGNLQQSGSPSFAYAAGANNRIVGFSYDAAGNQLQDGPAAAPGHSYVYDPENRIQSVDTTAATYAYDGDGNRVRKDLAGGDYTEYIYFGGQLIAERKPNGDWSDYIFANGKRVAKADSFVNQGRVHGTNSVANSEYSKFAFPRPGGGWSWTIQAGDKLRLRQYSTPGFRGGMVLAFTDLDRQLQPGERPGS